MNSADLHSAGATVIHKGKFSDIDVPSSNLPLEKEVMTKYVLPFYLSDPIDAEYKEGFETIKSEINLGIIESLLTNFNWRPRKAAADFAGIMQYIELEERIGKLLLRSDLCYSGASYCRTLALFNTAKSVEYIFSYLDYYLTQNDLDFDQTEAIVALTYLDGLNQTDFAKSLSEKWNKYNKKRSKVNLEKEIKTLEENLAAMKAL